MVDSFQAKLSALLLSGLFLLPFQASAQPQEQAPLPAPPPEDKTVRGVQISPGVGIYPIGYDRVNIGDAGTPDGGRWYFGLKPSVSINSALKTVTGKVVNFETGYVLDWHEYYNKGISDRDFTHDVYGEIDVPWTPRLSTHIHALFEYFYKAGEDLNLDNALYVEAEPALWIKANDSLSFKVGYFLYFLDIIDWKAGVGELNQSGDTPSDADEFRRGSFAADATGFDNYDPVPYGLIPTYGYATQAGVSSEQTVFHNWHAAVLGLKYDPRDGTSLTLDYRYLFAGFSNVDTEAYVGHFIIPSLSQSMPWKGGSLSVSDELRLKYFVDAQVQGTQDAKQNFRNRFTVALSQEVNEYLGLEAFYRLQTSGDNSDDYGTITNTHWFYMGAKLGF